MKKTMTFLLPVVDAQEQKLGTWVSVDKTSTLDAADSQTVDDDIPIKSIGKESGLPNCCPRKQVGRIRRLTEKIDIHVGVE